MKATCWILFLALLATMLVPMAVAEDDPLTRWAMD